MLQNVRAMKAMQYFKHYRVMTLWKKLCWFLSENCPLPTIGLLGVCVI